MGIEIDKTGNATNGVTTVAVNDRLHTVVSKVVQKSDYDKDKKDITSMCERINHVEIEELNALHNIHQELIEVRGNVSLNEVSSDLEDICSDTEDIRELIKTFYSRFIDDTKCLDDRVYTIMKQLESLIQQVNLRERRTFDLLKLLLLLCIFIVQVAILCN